MATALVGACGAAASDVALDALRRCGQPAAFTRIASFSVALNRHPAEPGERRR
jgi:hypothetical protein